MRAVTIVVTLLLMAPPALAAGQALFEPKRDPYRNLFGPPARVQRVQPTPPTALRIVPPTPKVVCGTVVIPADPKIDPKMVAKLPATSQTFTMRSVTPPVCKPE